MELDQLRKKSVRLERLYAELAEIERVEEWLNDVHENIDKERQNFFGLQFGSGMAPFSFALNGSTRYVTLVNNIVALTKMELETRKKSIAEELDRDFGGAE